MHLKGYLANLGQPEEARIAAESGATVGHIRNVASGFRDASPLLATAIERATAGAVTRRDLRPDDWHLIWPELADLEQKNTAEPGSQALVAINSETTEAVHG